MCKIIGIVGNHGTGRITAAWLLAQTIEEKRKGTSWAKYQVLFESWVKLVILDPAEATSTDHVILDSFGEHILDQVKQICPKLIEYDLHDDEVLDENLINPSTFGIIKKGLREEMSHRAVARFAMDDGFASEPEAGIWMTIREFIMYFASGVMKRFFGPNIWLNIATATADSMGSPDTRIYWDVKTQAELDYINDNRGTIIELRNTSRENKRIESYRDIKYLDPDIIIDTTDGLETCARIFFEAVENLR